MQASVVTLQEIIQGNTQYIIPLFQRTYSWKKKDWEDLWDDISYLYGQENPRPHFMGSIVKTQVSPNSGVVNKYLLIDGQQRLTTIFLLFAALRDVAKDQQEQDLSAEIDKTFLVNPFKKGSDYFKIQPTQLDLEYFQSVIRGKIIDKENTISQCYFFFKRKINEQSSSLAKLTEVICNHLSLVNITLGNDDDPYLVFESLNATGQPLTEADLIRNHLFMNVRQEEQQTLYDRYWLPMQEKLGDNLTEFIRHYLSKSGAEIRNNEIYSAFKNKLADNNPALYIEDLYTFSMYYAKLITPRLENNSGIRKYLDSFQRLEVSTIYPFLLNCYDDWGNSKLSEKDFIEVLKTLENFLVRRFVCGIQTRGLNKTFALLYSQVQKDAALNSEPFIKRLKISLQKKDYPKDNDFKEKLITIKLYGGNRSEKAKIILGAIEESFGHRETVDLSDSRLTIEHIMPQKLNDKWRDYLGTDADITHQLLVHTLGNLTLTAYNGELADKDFSHKKEELHKSHLEINKYFDSINSWQKEDIEQRAEYLAERVIKIWSYFGDDSLPVNETASVKDTKPKKLIIRGKQQTVKTWKDVLICTLNTLYDLDPEKFQEIVLEFPRFLSKDDTKFRRPQKLENNVFIVETNFSAKDIYYFCVKVVETMGLSSEDWSVEREPK